MHILMVGDVVGRAGRRAVREHLSKLVRDFDIDFVICNAENAAGGSGITREVANELFKYGTDVLTTGNHVWDKKEIYEFIEAEPRLLRPANYPPGVPGMGYGVFGSRSGVKIGIINLAGRVFLLHYDCPFRKADEIVSVLREKTRIICIDFHAEATSEKTAFGWYVDGRVSAVFGTHTHVQTADERILPGGTAYITDVGMTGPRDSVIGVKKGIVIDRFMTQMPKRFEVATGAYQLNAVMITVDEKTGRSRHIARISLEEGGE
ncbi:MAG: TIGR00282 family metallophosphoesterase [Desulfotomaculales bacterium]